MYKTLDLTGIIWKHAAKIKSEMRFESMSDQKTPSCATRQLGKVTILIQKILSFCINQKVGIAEHISDTRYKLRHLHQTNIDLGIYHIKNGNFNDAILRFKLISNFLSPNDALADYFLGWCYFFKHKYSKALEYFLISKDIDNIGLVSFLQNKEYVDIIPIGIWQKYRELNAKAEGMKWDDKSLDIPRLFVKELCDVVDALPKNCHMLDLGSGLGFIGAEISQKLHRGYHLTGVEDIEWMVEFAMNLDYGGRVYDAMHRQTIQEFLNTNEEKYDIITNLCSLGYAKNLGESFAQIYKRLNPLGHFAILLPTNSSTGLNLDICSFEYSRSDVEKQLKLAAFNIVSIKEWRVGRFSTYTMFITNKIEN